MKYNYFVNGKKATHTIFADFLRLSIAYSKDTIVTKEVHKRTNEKIGFCRNLLRYDVMKKVSWKSPIFENEMVLFEITKVK